MKQKVVLLLGFILWIVGLSIFACGYLTNYAPYVNSDNGQYTYIDYVALFGYGFGGLGVLILLSVFLPRFRSWAKEHGAITRG
jgi:hypothetical protein